MWGLGTRWPRQARSGANAEVDASRGSAALVAGVRLCRSQGGVPTKSYRMGEMEVHATRGVDLRPLGGKLSVTGGDVRWTWPKCSQKGFFTSDSDHCHVSTPSFSHAICDCFCIPQPIRCATSASRVVR